MSAPPRVAIHMDPGPGTDFPMRGVVELLAHGAGSPYPPIESHLLECQLGLGMRGRRWVGGTWLGSRRDAACRGWSAKLTDNRVLGEQWERSPSAPASLAIQVALPPTLDAWPLATGIGEVVETFATVHGADPYRAASVNYIANELAENDIKYGLHQQFSVALHVGRDALTVVSKSWMPTASVDALRSRLADLTARDPHRALIERIERNAVRPGRSAGLGYLTMILDHRAVPTWTFGRTDDGETLFTATLVIPRTPEPSMELEIVEEAFAVRLDPTTNTIVMQGRIRLSSSRYRELGELLRSVGQGTVTLDLRQVEFMNSAGINHLFQYAIWMREEADRTLTVQLATQHSWQRSLSKLTHFVPTARLDWT